MKTVSTSIYYVFLLFILQLFSPVLAQKPEDEVLQTQVRRFQAMIENDKTELEQLLADDLIYTHSNAKVETKQEFISALSQKVTYKSIQPADVKVRMYGPISIITGKADVTLNQEGTDKSMQLRFMDVYTKRKGRWQQIGWQSTRLPE